MSAPWPEARVGNAEFTQAAVLIIGGGISGMCVGIDLLKRGISNFIIVEKSAGIGGTWRDNKYPGCACDVFSILYSYSFEQKTDWTRLYPGQEEILDYLVTTAAKYNLYKYVRFNTTVDSAVWDDDTRKWKAEVRVSGEKDAEFNSSYTITSNFLVSAVGQLNQPSWPKIDGLDEFSGRLMHSARWDWSYDLAGKKIGIIGNGATAVQITPEVAKVASKLTVYQRTPNWVVYRMDSPTSAFQRTLFKWVPPVRWFTRSAMMDFRESTYAAVSDRDGDMSKEFRRQCLEAIEQNFPGDENAKLRQSLVPDYAPLCKRVLISDDYYSSLAKPHVHLETRDIERITSDAVAVKKDAGGTAEEELDLIICATGFKTVQFMHPVKLTGRNGRTLEDVWAKGARALHGVVVEDMPNFGMLYGPNTNLGHNSIILMIEQQTRYINTLIEKILQPQSSVSLTTSPLPISITPKSDRVAKYNEDLQVRLGKSVFADPKCNSWYKDSNTGLITNNWSDDVVTYQKELSHVDWSEFDVSGAAKVTQNGNAKKHIGRVREESYVSASQLTSLGIAGAVLGSAALVWRKSPFGFLPTC